MENTGYIAIATQSVLAQRMNMIANNIANMNTTAFKHQNILVTEQTLGDKPDSDTPIQSVMDYGLFSDFSQGPLTRTDNNLDFALEGDGFFVVQHAQTEERMFTRAGNFALNSQNELVTAEGHKVMGTGGPIIIPPESGRIEVDNQGVISDLQGEIGRFEIVEFENEQFLEERGGTLYRSRIAEGTPVTNTKVRQGSLEGSNVNGIAEMANMIEVSRKYQMNMRILQNEHERIQNAIRKLGALS